MNAMRIPRGITANPDPNEATIIARAQSLLTRNGRLGPVLAYRDAQRVVESGGKPRIRVTVPDSRQSSGAASALMDAIPDSRAAGLDDERLEYEGEKT